MVTELEQLLEHIAPPYDDLIHACIAADARITALQAYAHEDVFGIVEAAEFAALLDIAHAAVVAAARQSVLHTIGGGPLPGAVARFALQPWKEQPGAEPA